MINIINHYFYRVFFRFIYCIFIFLLFGCVNKDKPRDNSLDAIQKYLNIPPIENGWAVIEKDSNHILYGNKPLKVTTNYPLHLYKEVKVSSDQKISELDVFHNETKSSIAYRMICEYTYKNDSVFCKLIKYYKGEYPPTQSYGINKYQRDSIFTEWKFPNYYD
jgi:hypothetical protein